MGRGGRELEWRGLEYYLDTDWYIVIKVECLRTILSN